MRYLQVLVVGIVTLHLAFAVTSGPAAAAPAIEGAGSSFVQLEIEQWRSDVAKAPYSIIVNYVSSGSTFGRTQYAQTLIDFAVSDIPFQPDELAQAAQRPYTYVTVSAGGVGFMYNLRDTAGKRIGFPMSAGGTGTDLKLSPANVCRVFSEPGLRWNDPAIQAENPGIALPNRGVKPIFRQDGAGTSFVTMEYCIATAPDVWAKFVDYVKKTPELASQFTGDPFMDGKPSSRWPAFVGSESAFGSDGVANVVANGVWGEGAITAVEAGFAEIRGFRSALVRNAAGVYQYPEALNVNRALAFASRNSDATLTLDYLAPDPDAYFPVAFSYAIVPTTGFPADKGNSLGTFLNYAVTKGQEKADALGYAPLSCETVEISLSEIQRIPGAPPKPQTACGPPPLDVAEGPLVIATLGVVALLAAVGIRRATIKLTAAH